MVRGSWLVVRRLVVGGRSRATIDQLVASVFYQYSANNINTPQDFDR
jgi:hypothetical protein